MSQDLRELMQLRVLRGIAEKPGIYFHFECSYSLRKGSISSTETPWPPEPQIKKIPVAAGRKW